MSYIHQSAEIKGPYRYSLSRYWDAYGKTVLWVMLNPSTADHEKDDATIRKIVRYSKAWGFGGLFVGNLFALRARDPRDLKLASDPVGPENNFWLGALALKSPLVVCAWGVSMPGLIEVRAKKVKEILRSRTFDLKVLKLTKSGQPQHPLYLESNLQLQDWND